MEYLLKKKDFTLRKTCYSSSYEYEDEQIKIEINKDDFTEEEIAFTNKLINRPVVG